MKQKREKHIETREEKEARWAKSLKEARSFAKQANVKVKKEKKKISYDY